MTAPLFTFKDKKSYYKNAAIKLLKLKTRSTEHTIVFFLQDFTLRMEIFALRFIKPEGYTRQPNQPASKQRYIK